MKQLDIAVPPFSTPLFFFELFIIPIKRFIFLFALFGKNILRNFVEISIIFHKEIILNSSSNILSIYALIIYINGYNKGGQTPPQEQETFLVTRKKYVQENKLKKIPHFLWSLNHV